MGVSTVTVEHAYELLCDEGYIEARERSGFVVIFRESDGFAVSTPLPTQHPSHHTAQDQPDFPLSVFSKTMRKVLSDTESFFSKNPLTVGAMCYEQQFGTISHAVGVFRWTLSKSLSAQGLSISTG